mgnify:FL=1
MGYIYKISNNKTGETYIGQTTIARPIKRWRAHISHSRKGTNKNPLYRDMRILGEEHFTFEVIESTLDMNLNKREQYYMDLHDSINNGYNIIPAQGIRYRV